jgi:peptide/nickel transport system substrate-binding protein
MRLIRNFCLALPALVAAYGLSLPAASPARAETATYAMYGDVKDWDPSIAFSLEVMMLANVYEPLLWYNPPGSDQQFTPALATDWSVSDDGLTWTFNLREGVTFHDGAPFDAAAAKASIDRTLEMKKGAYYIWASVEAIEAPDAQTLVIRTKTPQPIDLIASSQYGAYMYSRKRRRWAPTGSTKAMPPAPAPIRCASGSKVSRWCWRRTPTTGAAGRTIISTA